MRRGRVQASGVAAGTGVTIRAVEVGRVLFAGGGATSGRCRPAQGGIAQ